MFAFGLLGACATDATGPSPVTEVGTGAGTNDSTPGSVPADSTPGELPSDSTPGEAPSDSTPGDVTAPAFLVCTAQPYAAGSAWIGPNGGEIKVGKTEFKVPKGALNSLTMITMELPSDTVKSVRFSPEGLAFNPGAWPELKLDYKGCPKQSNKGKGNAGRQGQGRVRHRAAQTHYRTAFATTMSSRRPCRRT